MTAPLLEIRGLTKHFPARGGGGRGIVRAVDDVSFSIGRGETFALVGESVCGKTTITKLILGLDDVTGSIATGKDADMVVLDANPIDGFRAFTHPRMVVARGHGIDEPSVTRHAELDERLDSI